MSGPLAGVRVVELGGIGPGPFGSMMLADLGATVVRLERPGTPSFLAGYDPGRDPLLRSRGSVAVDLKSEAGLALALRLAADADVLVDPYRPGTAERLGLGPEELLARNRRLVYARVTGWGQEGPWALTAGHDLNYLALSGTLSLLGRAGSPPPPPLNLVADFGGGGMLLVAGVCAALVERAGSGLGQVIDVAMVDGVALQTAMVHGIRQMGAWSDERESNVLDGGAPFYDTYGTADGRWVAVGALEPQFYAELLRRLELDPTQWRQWERACWPALRAALASAFAAETLQEWERRLAGTETCFAPVLTPEEAAAHPHNAARGTFVEAYGLVQPAPAPRFSRTPGAVRAAPAAPGDGGREALEAWGLTPAEIGAAGL